MAQKRETARTTQRHRALDVIFECDEKDIYYEEDILDLLAQRQEVSTSQVPIGQFGVDIVTAWAHHLDDIDTLIEAASEDWSVKRMNVVDRSILRGACAELMFVGTHRGPVVSQWADLAREFSTSQSVGFIMGVLNRAADIREKETSSGVE